MSYELYVVDDRGRSEVILDSHNKHGNRIWVLPEDKAFTIVLDHEGFRTYMVMDKSGDLIIEQDEEPPPKPKPKKRRRSRYR